MRIVIQRVSQASVSVEGHGTVASIDAGMLILVGVENGDTEEDARWLAGKTAALRIFDDAEGVMNRSVCDVRGGIIAVSQFTLTASTRRGNRPGYIRACMELKRRRYMRPIAAYCRKIVESLSVAAFSAPTWTWLCITTAPSPSLSTAACANSPPLSRVAVAMPVNGDVCGLKCRLFADVFLLLRTFVFYDIMSKWP